MHAKVDVDTLGDLAYNADALVADEDETEDPVHLSGNWYRYVHPETKQIYYHDIETGESKWEDPTGLCVYAQGVAAFTHMVDEVQNPMLRKMKSAVAKAKENSKLEEEEEEEEEMEKQHAQIAKVEKKFQKERRGSKWGKFKHVSVASRLKFAKMHQGDLYKRQKAERRAEYMRGRAKANWQRVSLAGLIAKRKSEGDRKGAMNLAWKQTGFLARLKLQKAKEEAEEAAEKAAEEKRLAAERKLNNNSSEAGDVELIGLRSSSVPGEQNEGTAKKITAEEQRKLHIDKRFRETTGKAPPPPKQKQKKWKKATRRLSALRVRRLQKNEEKKRRASMVANTAIKGEDTFGFGPAIGMLQKRTNEDPSKELAQKNLESVVLDVGEGEVTSREVNDVANSPPEETPKYKESGRRMSAFASRLHKRASTFKRTADAQKEKVRE